MTFKALLADKAGETISTSVVAMDERDLMPGDVSIAVDYSTVNFKDALAITGRGRHSAVSLIPGIDLAGTVEASSFPGIAVGDRVVANSWGLSQTHHGGYAQKARVKGEWLERSGAAFDKGRHGDRNGRVHGDAVRAGAGTWRHHTAAR